MIRENCREGCREAGKDPARFKFILQLHLSWAETDEEALANAMTEWPNGGMKFPKQDIRCPLDFEQMAKLVRPEDFEGRMLISVRPRGAPGARSRSSSTSASTRSTCTTSGATRPKWIEVFGRDVLPKLTA